MAGAGVAGSLEVIDKLAHAIKNIDKILESDEEYSGYYPHYMYAGDDTYRDGSYKGGSYARGGNTRRDSRGRYASRGYSRASESAIEQLRDIMSEVPEHMKSDVQRLITKMENM